MKVKFWGTRGSIAKPGPGTVRYGGNTSCVQVTTGGGHTIILDAGTGLHELGISLMAEPGGGRNGHILLSHTHWDHIQGIPFFKPLFVPGHCWQIYGPRGMESTLHEVLSGQMQHTYFPVPLEQLAADIGYHDLIEGVFEIDGIKVITRYNNHPGLTLAYRLEADGEAMVFATDHEPFYAGLARGGAPAADGEDRRHLDFMAGAGLVIHDTQYVAEEYDARKGWGHSTVEYAVDLACAARVGHLVLFHHDPTRDDSAVDALLHKARGYAASCGSDMVVSAAAEGMEVTVRGTTTPEPWVAEISRSALLDPDRQLGEQQIAVATNDAASLDLIKEATADQPYETLVYDSVGALHSRLATAMPALLLIDEVFDGRDALEIAGELPTAAAEDPEFQIVVMASETYIQGHQGSVPGISGWLRKPFGVDYARLRLRAWLTHLDCRWQPAPAPAEEDKRIAALRGLGILDTPAEERFDRYTRMAAAIFDVPVALVSLVDTHRQWFKSHHGLEADETPRDMAFCAHAILDDDVFYVKDALADTRFADNPLVTNEPHVRFYAGVPLDIGDGMRVGTLCIIDHRPKYLSRQQLDLLRDLGALVVNELKKKVDD